MRCSPRTATRHGLTLIEALVALAVAALVVTAAAALLTAVIRGSEISAGATTTHRMRAALADRLRADLESVYSITGRRDLVFRVAPANDEPDAAAEAVWTRLRSHPASGLEDLADVRRVAYACDAVAGRGGLCLLRMDRPAVGDVPDAEVEWDILVEEVREFTILASGGDGSWTNRWDSEVRQALPRGVRVRITAPELGSEPLDVRVAVPSVAGAAPAGGPAP